MFLDQQYPPTASSPPPGLKMTALTADQLAYINGTADFYAMDPVHGVIRLASPPPPPGDADNTNTISTTSAIADQRMYLTRARCTCRVT